MGGKETSHQEIVTVQGKPWCSFSFWASSVCSAPRKISIMTFTVSFKTRLSPGLLSVTLLVKAAGTAGKGFPAAFLLHFDTRRL